MIHFLCAPLSVCLFPNHDSMGTLDSQYNDEVKPGQVAL